MLPVMAERPVQDTPPAANPPCSLRVRIDGRVQGVCFRASTRDEARRLGLAGWVRNLPDGEVEALFEGSEDALRRMLAWCRTGPRGARVDRVAETWGPADGNLTDFTILQ